MGADGPCGEAGLGCAAAAVGPCPLLIQNQSKYIKKKDLRRLFPDGNIPTSVFMRVKLNDVMVPDVCLKANLVRYSATSMVFVTGKGVSKVMVGKVFVAWELMRPCKTLVAPDTAAAPSCSQAGPRHFVKPAVLERRELQTMLTAMAPSAQA